MRPKTHSWLGTDHLIPLQYDFSSPEPAEKGREGFTVYTESTLITSKQHLIRLVRIHGLGEIHFSEKKEKKKEPLNGYRMKESLE